MKRNTQFTSLATIAAMPMLWLLPAAASAQDEIGMAKELGPATWARCAEHLSNPEAKEYELSYIRSNTMPLSPFAGAYQVAHAPTAGLPGTSQVFSFSVLNEKASPGQQGTQMDALGHFARIDKAWDGESEGFATDAKYYGGLSQTDVKPTPDSPLVKLGIEKVRPIVTSAVLLDAKKHVGGGKAIEAGKFITPQHIEKMLDAQGMAQRGILPGDIVLVYTGWSDHYQDPDQDKIYYSAAPGFSYETAKYLGDKRVVAAGLDTPFVDAVAEGQLAGETGPPPGTPEGMVFAVHEHFLTQAGVHTLENLKLNELAHDQVSISCAMILPLREKGAAGSPIRPVAFGVPGR